jgi:hypothetical protein
MDKSWIMKPQGSDAYKVGVKEFIKFSFKDKRENIELICPFLNIVVSKNRKV